MSDSWEKKGYKGAEKFMYQSISLEQSVQRFSPVFLPIDLPFSSQMKCFPWPITHYDSISSDTKVVKYLLARLIT